MKWLAGCAMVLVLVASCASPKFDDGKKMFASLERDDNAVVLLGKILANTLLVPIYTIGYLVMIAPDLHYSP